MDHNELILFVHVPKAAGSTLTEILRRKHLKDGGDRSFHVIAGSQEIESFKSLPENDRRRIKFLTGHFYYGLHRYLPGKQPKYITM